MQHELFRHIEVEVFVARRYLVDAINLVREQLICYAAKDSEQRYVHHYPICIRRVLADDTLISPASITPQIGSAESWYAISLISYARPNHRAGFEAFAKRVVRLAIKEFQARPHWGKYCPVGRESVEQIYPNWPQFKTIVETNAPRGVFGNPWLDSLLANAPRGGQSDSAP